MDENIRDLLVALDDAIRQIKPGSDIQGGAEEYGFSRARDMAAKLVRTYTPAKKCGD